MAKVLVEESNLRNIADAIRSKSASTDTYKPVDMASAIEDIPSGSSMEEYVSEDITPSTVGINISGVTRSLKKVIDAKDVNYAIYYSNRFQLCYAFYGMEYIETIDGKLISEWDITKYTNLSNMFNYCHRLSEIPALRNWDTSNVVTLGNMFRYAGLYTDKPLNLEPISNWDTSNVTNFSYCFAQISKDKDNLNSYTKDVTLNWCIDKATTISYMFASSTTTSSTSGYGFMKGTFSGLYTTTQAGGNSGFKFNYLFNNQQKLEKIDLRNVNAKVGNVSYMFNNCFSLNLIDIRGFEMVKTIDSGAYYSCLLGVPNTTPIIVKDQTEKDWWTSKFQSWSFYTLQEALDAGIVED